jgi:hypothetical protein
MILSVMDIREVRAVSNAWVSTLALPDDGLLVSPTAHYSSNLARSAQIQNGNGFPSTSETLLYS